MTEKEYLELLPKISFKEKWLRLLAVYLDKKLKGCFSCGDETYNSGKKLCKKCSILFPVFHYEQSSIPWPIAYAIWTGSIYGSASDEKRTYEETILENLEQWISFVKQVFEIEGLSIGGL